MTDTPTIRELAEMVRAGKPLPDEAVAEYLPPDFWLPCWQGLCMHPRRWRLDPQRRMCREMVAEHVLRLDAEALVAEWREAFALNPCEARSPK